MQAVRGSVRAFATATRVLRSELSAKAVPNLAKVWKSYTYTRNQKIRQLSPFELDVLGGLFRDIPGKIKHKVMVRTANTYGQPPLPEPPPLAAVNGGEAS